MIRLPASSRGDERRSPDRSSAVAVRDAGDDHDRSHVLAAASARCSIGSRQDTIAGGLKGDVRDRGFGPVDPLAADLTYGLPVAGERVDGGVDHGGVEVGAGRVAGAGAVDGPIGLAEQARDRRPVVQVDHDRRGAAGGDGRLGVITYERRDLVAVVLQLGQDVRSDEPGCTRSARPSSVLPPGVALSGLISVTYL